MAFPRRLPSSAVASSSSVLKLSSETSSLQAARRVHQVARHMSSSSSAPTDPSPSRPQPPAFDKDVDSSLLSVLTSSRGTARTFTLNRPTKVNALNPEMVDLLHTAVDNWSASRLAKVLIGRGAGEKAFCAGGDIKHVAELASNVETRPEAMAFFKREFDLMWKLAGYSVGDHAWDGSKVYVALINGLTMGGGAGLSFGGVIRIATEKTQFAMPETIIGYTPDVGSTYYLNQLDGQIGTYLAVTGETIVGRSCLELGIATHYVPSHILDELHDRLESMGDIDKVGGVQGVLSVVEDYEMAPRIETPEERARLGLEPVEWDRTNPNSPTRFVGAVREALDEAFAKKSLVEIEESLKRMVLPAEKVTGASKDAKKVSSWAQETLDVLATRSRISMEVALLGMRRAAEDAKAVAYRLAQEGKRYDIEEPNLGLKLALEREYRAVEQFVHNESPDFPSGVIRKLVAKLPANFATPSTSTVALAKAFYPTEEAPLRPSTPALELLPPVHGFDKYAYRAFGLPSEDEIRRIVRGEHKTSGDYKVNARMVLETALANFNINRPGVEARVREVLDRMCTTSVEGWLSWKSSRDVKSREVKQ